MELKQKKNCRLTQVSYNHTVETIQKLLKELMSHKVAISRSL